VSFSLLAAIRGQLAITDVVGGEAEIRLVRPRLFGHLGPRWMTWFFQADFGGEDVRLLDYWLQARPLQGIGVRPGQFLMPFGYAFYSNAVQHMFPENASVGDYFGLGRDTSLMLFGTTPDRHFAYFLAAGIGRPVTLEDTSDTEVRDGLIVGRVEVMPF